MMSSQRPIERKPVNVFVAVNNTGTGRAALFRSVEQGAETVLLAPRMPLDAAAAAAAEMVAKDTGARVMAVPDLGFDSVIAACRRIVDGGGRVRAVLSMADSRVPVAAAAARELGL